MHLALNLRSFIRTLRREDVFPGSLSRFIGSLLPYISNKSIHAKFFRMCINRDKNLMGLLLKDDRSYTLSPWPDQDAVNQPEKP